MDTLFRWITAGVFLVTSPFVAIGAHEAWLVMWRVARATTQRPPG